MKLAEKDRKYVWHPFTVQKNMPDSIAIAHAKGSLLFDESGRSYIDSISSWWVNLHGHAHEYIAEKIYRQALTLEHVIFAGFTHKPAVELAERLLQLLPPGFAKIFYSDDGSTATEVALKMAIQFWWNTSADVFKKRNKILAFKNAYHGDTFGAMSVSDRSVFTLAFHDLLFDVIFVDTPTNENIHVLTDFIEQQGETIAAFIYEPLVQGAGGMHMYEAYAMNQLLLAVQSKGIICIADEVMTGFGRTGKTFASEYMLTKPDIICLSKGLTGGTMALAATACNEKIYNAYINDDKLKTFFHGHSFTANPLACTAALASMDLLQRKETTQAITSISEENSLMKERLINNYHGLIKNVRSLGTILAFEILQGKDEYLNNISTVITKHAFELGVYIRPLGNTLYIMPPYCITKNELHKIYNSIEIILNEMQE